MAAFARNLFDISDGRCYNIFHRYAGMAELADAYDSGNDILLSIWNQRQKTNEYLAQKIIMVKPGKKMLDFIYAD